MTRDEEIKAAQQIGLADRARFEAWVRNMYVDRPDFDFSHMDQLWLLWQGAVQSERERKTDAMAQKILDRLESVLARDTQ
jgi:hypothetical protein